MLEDPTGARLVIEVKYRTKPEEKNRTRPLPIHIRQLMFYMEKLDADSGLLLIITPKKVETKAIKKSGSVIPYIEDRATYLYKCLKYEKPPKPEKKPYLCTNCPFRLTKCQT